MKILFIGDIVGRSGREAVEKNLTVLKKKFNPDIIIANAENAASGYGLTKKIANDFFAKGVDVITLGNHSWDQREMLSFIEECPKIIRPINYPKGVPGNGYYKLTLEDGRSIVVMQVMLRLFIGLALDDPFQIIEDKLKSNFLGSNCNAIFIDMHGEATSEKTAFGHFVDGKVTAALGTHTHIPTSDEKILNGGTAYQTDVGMSGDYNSVIGMEKAGPIHSFRKGFRLEGRFSVATGEGKVCGSFVESDDNTGLATNIERFQL
jgi:metallophosphoesterase, MG_246/BB_0505 family